MAADLWTQLKKARNDDYHEEKEATADLRDLRNQEIEAELPHPQCCDLAKKHVFAYRVIDILKEQVLNDGVPVWRSAFNTGWDSGSHERVVLQMNFCPFCGTKLPALRLKAEPPPHIIIEGTTSNHCGRCKERYGMGYCFCSHPESAFEPVPV